MKKIFIKLSPASARHFQGRYKSPYSLKEEEKGNTFLSPGQSTKTMREESLLSYSWFSEITQQSQDWVLELLTSGLPVHLVLDKFYTKLSILAELQVQEQMSGMYHESRHNPVPNFLSDKLGYFWLQVGIPLLFAICWNPVYMKTKKRAVKYFRQLFCPERTI